MFCKTEDADVEIIVDADATIQLEVEMIDIETSDPIDDDFYAQYNSTNSSKSNTPRKQSLWQGFGEPPVNTDVDPHAAVTAVPKESGHLKPDDIEAHCIEVMDSVGSPSPSYDRYAANDVPYCHSGINNESSLSMQQLYDFLH